MILSRPLCINEVNIAGGYCTGMGLAYDLIAADDLETSSLKSHLHESSGMDKKMLSVQETDNGAKGRQWMACCRVYWRTTLHRII